MGHIGLTPRPINTVGKVRVQGKDRDQARALLADALAVQEAGAFSMVLELMPGAARRGRSPSGCASRPSASARAPAAAARSRSSRTCSASATSSRATLGRTPTLRETIVEAARAYAADVDGRHVPGRGGDRPHGRGGPRRGPRARGAPDRASGTIPVGGIPLDRDL